jgi:endoglucanase
MAPSPGGVTLTAKIFKESVMPSRTRPLAAAFVLLLLPVACAASAYVRVNQAGYESGLSARAYLMSTKPESGATFAVKNSSGNTVYSANIGAKLGAWGSYSVYPLDFTVSTSGTYTISVKGPLNATSVSFAIDTASNLYSNAVTNALDFYQNERDGANFISSPLRSAAGHLNDASATVYNTPQFDSNDLIIGSLTSTGAVINAAGGWWDAGDYLKFVQTHSYAVTMLEVGVRDFPNQMGSGSLNSNFTNEAQFGLDWLQAMWDDTSQTLYYQTGIGTDFESYNYQSDHDLWRLPQDDDTYGGTNSTYKYIRNRPVFVAGAAGSQLSPNLAGRMAAALALCFKLYQSSDAPYANQCLLSGEHIFDLANQNPNGNLLTTAPYDFYPENEWRDDLELGATELYFAVQSGNLPPGLPHTDPMFYLSAAANWAYNYIHGPNDAADTLNLYDVSGLAHFELYRAIALAGNPPGLKVSQTDLLNDMAKALGNATAQAGKDPFGFGFPWAAYDTATHAAGLSVMAKEYYYLTATTSYDRYSRRWMANLLGTNAWGSSFIVGDGSTFPDCMQHQVANIVGSTNGQPPVLAGALVEGPNTFAATGLLAGMVTCPPGGGDAFKKFNANGAVYKDNVQSYSTVEPAIDLTAASPLMFAWRIAGAPSGNP